MPSRTITFEVTTAQAIVVREAFEFEADQFDPENAPHSFAGDVVLALVRKVMMGALRLKIRRLHTAKAELTEPGPPSIDDVI